MKLYKMIKDFYYDEKGNTKYSNIEEFIERNMDLCTNVIFPLLPETNYDLIQLSKCYLQQMINEQKGQISRHQRYLTIPNEDLKNWNAWDIAQHKILSEYENRLNYFDLNKEIDEYINLHRTIINSRIDSFKCDLMSNDNQRTNQISIWYSDIVKYLAYFNNNQLNIFSLHLYWYYYEIYNLHEKFETNVEAVRELYAKYNVDIDEDPQFSKYQLIQVNNFKSNPPQFYEKRIDGVIFIKNCSNDLIELFLSIKDMICEISFQINPASVLLGVKSIEYCLEALEIGKIFDLDSLGQVSIDKLCDEHYSNFIWITKDSKNLTFEEIVDDFEINGDDIITQVLHLEYEKDNDSIIITHIDHEYILYDIEEYENRKTNSKMRGKGKIKTFKIDKSRVPLFFKGTNILYRILSIYFKNTSLLREYFSKYIE